jgi:hypothetical protein
MSVGRTSAMPGIPELLSPRYRAMRVSMCCPPEHLLVTAIRGGWLTGGLDRRQTADWNAQEMSIRIFEEGGATLASIRFNGPSDRNTVRDIEAARRYLREFSLWQEALLVVDEYEIDLPFLDVGTHHLHRHRVARAVGGAGVFPAHGVGGLVVDVVVVIHLADMDEAFNQKLGELHEDAELGHTTDDALEDVTDMVLYVFDLFELHRLPLGLFGVALLLRAVLTPLG